MPSAPINCPSKLTLWLSEDDEQVFEFPYVGNGFTHEAAEVMHCLRQGKLQSEILPLSETLSIMETLDAIRAQWGLAYPGE